MPFSGSVLLVIQQLAVWRCTKRYPLTYVKYGRTVRYRRKDLDAFIESGVTRIQAPEVSK